MQVTSCTTASLQDTFLFALKKLACSKVRALLSGGGAALLLMLLNFQPVCGQTGVINGLEDIQLQPAGGNLEFGDTVDVSVRFTNMQLPLFSFRLQPEFAGKPVDFRLHKQPLTFSRPDGVVSMSFTVTADRPINISGLRLTIMERTRNSDFFSVVLPVQYQFGPPVEEMGAAGGVAPLQQGQSMVNVKGRLR